MKTIYSKIIALSCCILASNCFANRAILVNQANTEITASYSICQSSPLHGEKCAPTATVLLPANDMRSIDLPPPSDPDPVSSVRLEILQTSSGAATGNYNHRCTSGNSSDVALFTITHDRIFCQKAI